MSVSGDAIKQEIRQAEDVYMKTSGHEKSRTLTEIAAVRLWRTITIDYVHIDGRRYYCSKHAEGVEIPNINLLYVAVFVGEKSNDSVLR